LNAVALSLTFMRTFWLHTKLNDPSSKGKAVASPGTKLRERLVGLHAGDHEAKLGSQCPCGATNAASGVQGDARRREFRQLRNFPQILCPTCANAVKLVEGSKAFSGQ
jgi:hypothetical protein